MKGGGWPSPGEEPGTANAVPAACAAALAALPGAGPASLGRLLGPGRDPVEAWADVVSGRLARPEARHPSRAAASLPLWKDAARSYDVVGRWQRLRSQGIGVTWPGQVDFPQQLERDPMPPAVLFWLGDLAALRRRCVALVGTRRATAGGRDTAFELGRDLAAAGVCVVSGLALGIDGAAHRGALSARVGGGTVGVAASGVDRVYPRRHAELWQDVASCGAVLSETPPGCPAQAWRFPARNRIIAGLVSMVVVVESHETGGSLITADAAIERGIDVRVVPGPIRSPASAGTNRLLFDGPGPVRDARDILEALDLVGAHPRRRGRVGGRTRGCAGPTPADVVASDPSDCVGLGARERVVLEAVGWVPTSLNRVVAGSGLGVAAVSEALEGLVERGLVVVERDWWQRRR